MERRELTSDTSTTTSRPRPHVHAERPRRAFGAHRVREVDGQSVGVEDWNRRRLGTLVAEHGPEGRRCHPAEHNGSRPRRIRPEAQQVGAGSDAARRIENPFQWRGQLQHPQQRANRKHDSRAQDHGEDPPRKIAARHAHICRRHDHTEHLSDTPRLVIVAEHRERRIHRGCNAESSPGPLPPARSFVRGWLLI